MRVVALKARYAWPVVAAAAIAAWTAVLSAQEVVPLPAAPTAGESLAPAPTDAALPPAVQPALPVDAQPALTPIPDNLESGTPRTTNAVHLRADGNVPGTVYTLDASGIRIPVSVAVNFVQAGQVLFATHSDERGHFQGVGLRPGVYSVIAFDEEGLGVARVAVLPYSPALSEAEVRIIEIDLIPMVDAALLCQVLCQAAPPMAALPAAPCPVCGAGGGGGAGLGMAGLGGLGGLAGLAGGDDEPPPPPATPFDVKDGHKGQKD